jgi:hypothetical protein
LYIFKLIFWIRWMVEETPGCIPWPACLHSHPKNTIKRMSCTSRWVLHHLPVQVPLLRGYIDGPELQCSPLLWSSSIRPTYHHTHGLLVCSLSWSVFVQREKRIFCNQTTFSIFKILSMLTFCDIFDHLSYLFIFKKLSYILLKFVLSIKYI